ncbi:MAG: flagellar protein FlaG [Methylococcales bacterium]
MNSEITNASKPVLATPTMVRSVQQSSESTPLASVERVAEPPLQTAPAATAQNAKQQTPQEVSLDTVKTAAATGNSILQATNRNLEFQVDDSTKRVVVKIVDSQSGKVLRQIPSEDMLAFIDKMQQLEGDKGSVLQDRA